MISREVLSEAIFLSNPDLLSSYEQVADRLLERLSSLKIWTNKVLTLLSRDLLNGERPDIESIARGLAAGTRKLQYQLKAEGTTYQALFDHVRKEIALEYINKSDVTLYDIAFLLGFSEQSSFNHAFKKWTGSKPTEHRKRITSVLSEQLFATT